MRSVWMRATLLLLASVVALAVPGAIGVAAGEEARPQHQAWAQTGAVPVAGATTTDRLYVSSAAGAEQARSFIQLDGISAGVLDRAQLVLREDASDSVLGDTAQVTACALIDPLVADGRLEGSLPKVDCTVRVDPIRGADGRWTIPLGVFAHGWTSSGRGIGGLALLPAAADAAASFRVALDPARTSVVGLVRSDPDTTGAAVDPASHDVPSADGGGIEPLAPIQVDPGTAGPPPPGPSPTLSSPSAAEPEAAGAPGAVPTREADSPAVLPFLLGLAAVSLFTVFLLRHRGRRVKVPARLAGSRGVGLTGATAALSLALLPLAFSEITVYKAGLLLIFLVAALGLHVLVNWTGQLSLAHAGMVGLPAFVVITVSEIKGISPLYLLPLGVITGAALGALVALPTIRARGLQVALVTLVAGIAIDRFFFTKTWLVGGVNGRTAATPALGPLELTTARALYPVLLAIVALTLVALWALMHSRVARSWFWIRANPDAAAAFGIPVTVYKIAAFATAGALAGLAGSLTVTWVQRSSAGAFPTSLSYSYLLVAVLAGSGYAGGVATATLLLEGGRVFLAGAFGNAIDDVIAYVGPLALLFNITVYKAGFNGAGRQAMEKLEKLVRRDAEPEGPPEWAPEPLGLGAIAGTLAVAAGFMAIALAWYHAGNTGEVWIQNQELLSGGVGGLALVVVGVGVLIGERLNRQQAILAAQQRLLARQLEVLLGAAAESETVASAVPAKGSQGRRGALQGSDGDGPVRRAARVRRG